MINLDLSYTRKESICRTICFDIIIECVAVIDTRENRFLHYEMIVSNCDQYLKTLKFDSLIELFEGQKIWLLGDNAEMVREYYHDVSAEVFI